MPIVGSSAVWSFHQFICELDTKADLGANTLITAVYSSLNFPIPSIPNPAFPFFVVDFPLTVYLIYCPTQTEMSISNLDTPSHPHSQKRNGPEIQTTV